MRVLYSPASDGHAVKLLVNPARRTDEIQCNGCTTITMKEQATLKT